LTQLWADQGVDVDGNKLVADLIREKIRTIVTTLKRQRR
jgi:hypothetical protein